MNIELKKLANTLGGQITNRVEAKRDGEIIGNSKILLPKAISNGAVNHENLSAIDIRFEIDEKKLTKSGDIILKLSQPYDAAYITEKDENLLVTSFCLILRDFDNIVNPRYLLSVINSEVYKEQALSLTSGATVPILTKGSIEKMIFDIPPMAEQKKVIDAAEEITVKEKLFSEIIKLEKMKLENMLRGEF